MYVCGDHCMIQSKDPQWPLFEDLPRSHMVMLTSTRTVAGPVCSRVCLHSQASASELPHNYVGTMGDHPEFSGHCPQTIGKKI